MKTLLLSVFLLSGCNTFSDPDLPDDGLGVFLQEDVKTLQEDVRRLDYFIDHNMCFTMYGVCLGEKKKEPKACWKLHEECVIRVYKQWKKK
jgi:hypothetical protein